MSADNWTICPRCKRQDDEARAAKEQAVRDSYGKVPAEDYETMRAEVLVRPDPEETLREDWDIGIYNSRFSVHYRAGCAVCGFSYEHKHEKGELA